MGRVLVVDDNPAICELLIDILVEEGLEVVCAHNDSAAYALIPTLPTFSTLIVDVNLGHGTTGFDVARFARQVIPDLYVVYITGEASPGSSRAFGVPESDFMQKPFAPSELVEKLRTKLVD